MASLDDDLRTYLAALANAEDIGEVAGRDRQRLVAGFARLRVRYLSSVLPRMPRKQLDREARRSSLEELAQVQTALQDALSGLIPSAIIPNRAYVALGKLTVLDAPIRPRLVPHGRRFRFLIDPVDTSSPGLAMLVHVFRTSGRQPFWWCKTCGRVIPQPVRGRSVRYCSARCRTKGIPSAKKRAKYVRANRERRRQEDLGRAKRAIRNQPKDKRYAALKKAFPDRPRRALLYLLKRSLGARHREK